jgi:hypothetical protein
VERLKQRASERAAAAHVGVPRSTLRNWSRRPERINLPASVVAFFECPEGVDFLHGMLVAAHLVSAGAEKRPDMIQSFHKSLVSKR